MIIFLVRGVCAQACSTANGYTRVLSSPSTSSISKSPIDVARWERSQTASGTSDRGEIAMTAGTVTSVVLASALASAIANLALQPAVQQPDATSGGSMAGQGDCGTTPGMACAGLPRVEHRGSRCTLPPDRDT
jgi:uncharacterized membrane protein